MYYIAGLNTNVTISSNSSTVKEGGSFNFTCGSTRANATRYDVFINGKDSGEDHQRLIPTTKTDFSQSYSFTKVSFTDNTHTIQCAIKNINPDYSYTSPEVQLNVQCKSYDYHMKYLY